MTNEEHKIKSRKVDASSKRPHEREGNFATVLVHIWCTCGRHIQGTFKVPMHLINDDDVMRDAINRADTKAQEFFDIHAPVEAPVL